MKRARAFTLIELLVTIGIIAVLISILIPTLAKIRASAWRAKCLSNAREISTSVEAFAGDHAGRLPENRTLTSSTTYITWRGQFLRDQYVTDASTWTCPAHRNPGPRSELGGVDDGAVCVEDPRSSYALNGHVLWRRDSVEDDARRPANVIARPSHTILIAESNRPNADLRASPPIIANYYNDSPGPYAYWHQGAGVYAFQDGHAEVITLLDTGNPDCRWHNGQDLSDDPFVPQTPQEFRPHAHPDWAYLVPEIYLNP
jgi:prepilin-type N-terminal cleavage/methylation domain-containing protein/prepilin-type processing-associated H-X9-DG protein